MLRQVFNTLTRLHSRVAVLKRFAPINTDPDLTTNIRITPSNYFRFLEGPSHTVVKGREFIIPKDSMETPLTPLIKRGDKIVDTEYGSMAIDEIMEMVDLGGSVMGWRVRVE